MLENIKTNVYNREYKYDNIKAILIFLVLFGHVIESVTKFNLLYLIIYSFHMPIFVFVSGYFSKGNKKSILKQVVIYFIFQTIYFLLYKFILHENIPLNYLQPIWIMWYIFALAIWNSLLFLIKKMSIIKNTYVYLLILLAFLLSLICGYIDKIGYFLSLSRIISFFPFFLLGYFTKNISIKIIKKDSNNVASFMYCFLALICILYFVRIPNINKIWFYGSYSYKNGGYNIIFKFFSNVLSLCMIYYFNNFVPNKKSILSFIGKNTLYIYLFHGIIIKVFSLNTNNLLENNNALVGIIIATIYTLFIIIRYRYNRTSFKKNI